jgi:hypothetical protein
MLGPGQYGGSASFENAKQMTVRGAGEGQTVLDVGSGGGLGVGGNGNDLVTSLTIDVTGGGQGLSLNNADADHVDIQINAAPGTGALGFITGPATITNSSVTATGGSSSVGPVDVEGGLTIIQDSTLSGSVAVASGDTTILQRDRIAATATGVECLAGCVIQDSLITMSAGSSFGLVGRCSSHATDVNASNLTIVGPAVNSVAAQCAGSGNAETVELSSSILRGETAHALDASATAASATATITPTYDDYDPASDLVSTGTGSASIASPGIGQINADPLFVDPSAGDYRLQWNSPAVDSGDPAAVGLLESPTDLDGGPRIVNARRDLGALEYQRTPPTASVSANVTAAAARHAIRFDGSKSSDPDGDTLTYAWRADDGATGTGTGFTHAFTKAGSHTVTLTVTDPIGLAATASATVTVTAAPPTLTKLKQSHKHWNRRRGTTFSFRLDQAATATLAFSHKGHAEGTLRRRCHAGLNTIHFAGRVARHRRLATGPQTVRITATGAGGRSKPHTLRFTITG